MKVVDNKLGRRVPWLVALAIGAPANSQQDETAGSWSFDPAVAVVSDYRFRGYSLSSHKPAVQPEFWLTHQSGLYLGFWGSNVADLGGDGIEFDPAIGFAKSLPSMEVEVWATYYLYPGADQFNYVEIGSKISTMAGRAKFGVEVGYAPAQANIGGIDNRYASAFASVPLGATQISLDSTFGVEDGAFGSSKIDWSLGLTTELHGFAMSAQYVDAARHGASPLAEPTIVAAIKFSF